jgi:hypothetical protein
MKYLLSLLFVSAPSAAFACAMYVPSEQLAHAMAEVDQAAQQPASPTPPVAQTAPPAAPPVDPAPAVDPSAEPASAPPAPPSSEIPEVSTPAS